ncbi:MAG: M48 family metalloprotease [Myxococcaceae bacterium]
MKKAIIIGCVLAASGCASLQRTLNAASRGDARGLASGAADLEAERKRIKAKQDQCAALEKQQATYEEETGIGGAVALNLASRTAGVYIEISPDLASAMPQAGVKPKPGKGPKTDLTAYINRIGKTLASSSSRPGLDWTFVVLDSETPNAFSAPGGYVFITTGMIAAVDNEAQLAAVLGHEIGHITGRHAMTAYAKTKATSCNVAMGAGLVANAAKDAVSLSGEFESLMSAARLDLNKASADLIVKLSDGLADELVSRGNGPEFEHQADAVAYELMVFSGYDPNEFEKLLAKLPDGGFLTPHPANKARITKLEPLKKDYADWAGGLKAPALDPVAKVVKK